MNLTKLTLNHLIAFFLGSICLGLVIFSGRNGLQAIQKSLSVDETVVVSSAIFLNKKGINEVLNKLETGNQEEEKSNQETEVRNPSNSASRQEEDKSSELEDLGLKMNNPINVEIINSSGVDGAAAQLSAIFDKEKTNIILKNGEEVLDESKVFYKNGYIGWKAVIDNKLVEIGFEKALYESFDEDLDLRIVIGRKN